MQLSRKYTCLYVREKDTMLIKCYVKSLWKTHLQWLDGKWSPSKVKVPSYRLSLKEGATTTVSFLAFFGRDRFRTMINVLGDALAAGIIAHICRKDFTKEEVGKSKETFCRETVKLRDSSIAVSFWKPCNIIWSYIKICSKVKCMDWHIRVELHVQNIWLYETFT